MTEQWVSLHLFYHDDPLPLLLECVQPAVAELQARHALQRFFFIRYWQGGPHVRLRLLPRSEAEQEIIQELVTARAEAFFATHPAQFQIGNDEYVVLRSQRGLAEYGEEDHTPLYPNNSLSAIPYQPEYERYGGARALPLVEQHFMESSEIALALLQRKPTHDQLSGQALAMMFLAAFLCEEKLDIVRTSFENYHSWWKEASSYRLRFQALYVRQKQKIQDLMGRLTTLQHDAQGQTDVLSRWISSIHTLKDRLAFLEQEQSGVPGASEEGRATLLEIVFSCIHMHNNRLGVSPIEEAYLAFLLKETLAVMAPVHPV